MNISSWVGKRITVDDQEIKLIQDPKLIAIKQKNNKKARNLMKMVKKYDYTFN